MRKIIRSVLILFSATAALALISYAVILYAFPFPYEELTNIKYSKSIYDKDHNILRAFTNNKDQWLMPISLDEINPNLINATLAIEDKRFFDHPGVDIGAVLRAIELNISNKRVISGASTITMQAIRILKRRERSMKNKIVEAAHAIYLDLIYTKEEILELYFEIAPYGGNIHGVKAASMRYFKKHPKDLSLSECALLAGLPQSPSRLRPDRYPLRAKQRRGMVLSSMLKNNFITKAQYNVAKDDPIVAGNHKFPFKAAHFTRFMKNKFKKEPEIITTLDSNMQHFAEAILRDKVSNLKPYGVTNGAVVVIENKTGAIRAMVGSADFFSNSDSGQINGTLSRRCPGSTLKPFTYAIAFAKGICSPDTLLEDSPVQYNGYMPLDYDKEYRGQVTAKDALIDSLNIPAVEVLDKVGYNNLYYLLERLGISTLNKSPEYYGLSLTLGSCEARLIELANAYACLARLGVYRPIQYNQHKTNNIKRRVISQGAAYQVADILSDTSRLETIGIYRDEKLYPKIAFKTGTSYDHKDAWTIAYNPEYTIGIWIGNFSGRSSKALVGIEAATPVAVRIFDWLYTNKTSNWYSKPTIMPKPSLPLQAKQDSHTDPKIISPASGCEYFITNIGKQAQQLPFIGTSGSEQLYWFVDGKFYSKVNHAQKLFWPMEKGLHEITCSDIFGQSSTVHVVVR